MSVTLNILLVGSGGREHALALALSKSPLLKKCYVSPGSDAMALLAEKVALPLDAHDQIVAWCQAKKIDLVVIGPEQPLVAGIADALLAAKILVFGPNAKAAQFEGSKIFMKEFLVRHQIPTADFQVFTQGNEAKNYILAQNKLPIIVKTDGLAAGKGVFIAYSQAEAVQAVDAMMAGKFGDAGRKIIIEEFMVGEEISWFAIADGKHAQFLGSAQDYKRVSDGDLGLNTGGMGAFSPARQENLALNQHIIDTILQPFMRALQAENLRYQGILFFGIMLTDMGAKIIEINIRFGDPECQVLCPRIEDDLLALFYHAARGKLPKQPIQLKSKTALTIVYAAKGYPESYGKGGQIHNVGAIENSETIQLYHAGTLKNQEGYIANGGRVLNVTAIDEDIAIARAMAYKRIAMIDWQDGFYRRDIGL